MGGQRCPGPVCCVHGSTWWHVEGVRAPGLLPGWVRLWLLLSSSVWPLLKFSKTSRSGSVLVQGKGSSFNRLLLSLTPCFEDRQTLSTVTQASSHRNRAKTNIGVEAGLFAPLWSPNSPCPRSRLHHEGAALPKALRSINPSPPGCQCPGPGCWLVAPALPTPGHTVGVGEGNVGLLQPLSSAGCGPGTSGASENLLHLPQCEMCGCPRLRLTHLARCLCYRPRPARPWGSHRPLPRGSRAG